MAELLKDGEVTLRWRNYLKMAESLKDDGVT